MLSSNRKSILRICRSVTASPPARSNTRLFCNLFYFLTRLDPGRLGRGDAMPKARCAVLRRTDQPYSIETVEVGEPGPDEALVRIVATGWCHTDRFGRSGLLGEHFLPAVLGHEARVWCRRSATGSLTSVPATTWC